MNSEPTSPQAAADKRSSPESQYALGEKYEYGEGYPKDYKKAAVWYRRAAGQGHAQAREKLTLPWFNGEVEQMTAAPTLFTGNGIGFKLYGKSDYHAATDSFMATYYFVIMFIPIAPISRFRVISDDGYSYQFLGKGRLRLIDKLHIAVVAGAFLAFMLSAKLKQLAN